MDPRDLVARRILFEEGYVTTLESNTPPPPFLTPRVALSKAFFSTLEQGPRNNSDPPSLNYIVSTFNQASLSLHSRILYRNSNTCDRQ